MNHSFEMRSNPLFMRNSFLTSGMYELPIIRKQKIDLENIGLISYSDTQCHASELNRKLGVHFFIDDYRFEGVYSHPERSLNKLKQYAFLLSPDFSTYADMNVWRQIESVAKNRWLGAYWQSNGLIVIPTIGWSSARSFEFCFDGVEKGATVAVGMIGAKKNNKVNFMRGYDKMLEKIEPDNIICFGTPFQEMKGNLIVVDYLDSRKVVR